MSLYSWVRPQIVGSRLQIVGILKGILKGICHGFKEEGGYRPQYQRRGRGKSLKLQQQGGNMPPTTGRHMQQALDFRDREQIGIKFKAEKGRGREYAADSRKSEGIGLRFQGEIGNRPKISGRGRQKRFLSEREEIGLRFEVDAGQGLKISDRGREKASHSKKRGNRHQTILNL